MTALRSPAAPLSLRSPTPRRSPQPSATWPDATATIDVRSNELLSQFRRKVKSQLDALPTSWVFLRGGVPVGTRQETSKRLDYVASGGGRIHIKAADYF